ncbi:MAG: ABC transporter ATP-binding protein [Thermodesulfobacteriota bacterium]
MPEPILSISGLEAYYGKSHVLQGVDLYLNPAELVVVVGRNGMGKTTLLKSILGYPPVKRQGRIMFQNEEIVHKQTHQIAASGLGYVPQGRLLFPSLSVEEHLRLAGARQRPGGKKWTTREIYRLFPEIERRAQVGGCRLSGGEQQMLAIARALMTGPSLLMMDEPSEGLSQSVIERVEQICRHLIAAGVTILLVEQNLEMAQTLADRAYVFLNGQVALEQTGEDFRKNPERVRSYLGV